MTSSSSDYSSSSSSSSGSSSSGSSSYVSTSSSSSLWVCSAPNDPYTAWPVNYHSGQIAMSILDIDIAFGTISFPQRRDYDYLKYGSVNSLTGFSWRATRVPTTRLIPNFAYRTEFSDDDTVNFSLTPSSDGTYPTLDNFPETLQRDNVNQTFIVTRSDLTVWIFSDNPNGTTPQGLPVSAETVAGNRLLFFYDGDNHLSSVQASHSSQPNTTISELDYQYYDDGHVASITKKVNDGNSLVPIKRVVYSYYGSDETSGSDGDLKTVATELYDNDNWDRETVYYYRYYKTGDTNGKAHTLKMAFFPEEFALLDAAFADDSYLDEPDENVLNYSTKYYEYDEQSRVVREQVDRNQKQILMEYAELQQVPNPDKNDVAQMTTVTGPYGETYIVFTNSEGTVLLREELAPQGNDEPVIIHYFVYNDDGKLIRYYTPQSVLGYSLQTTGGAVLNVSIADHEGLIEITEYDIDSTTTSKSNIRRELVRQGEQGTAIPVTAYEYEKRSVGWKIAWNKTEVTRFANEDGTNAGTTQFSYTYYPDSLQIATQTTLLPIVDEIQNGDGLEAVTIEYFDVTGKLRWEVDALGIITYHQYDTITGLRTKTIVDVDVTKIGDFNIPVPSGMTTVTGAGKHLITEYEYDSQQRRIETLGPANTGINDQNESVQSRIASWTVYDDVHHTIKSANGYATLDDNEQIIGFTLVNPVSITIQDVFGNVTDNIQASRASTDGKLTETDTFGQDSYIAWTKNFYEYGELVVTRQYFDIPATGEGTKDVNYYESLFVYDSEDRRIRIVDPTGTITKIVYDYHGNTIQEWIGTDDGEGSSNMVLVTESEYGHSGSCATCSGRHDQLLAQVQHVDTETSRAIEFQYDWRGRQTHTIGEEDTNGNVVYSEQTYDNIDRVIKSEQFLVQEPSDRLLSRTEQFYDTRGNVWKTEQSVVDPATGNVQGILQGQAWFDDNGQEIKSQNYGRNYVTVQEYDSLGYVIAQKYIADNVTLQMQEFVYDNVGNVVLSIVSEKKYDSNNMVSQYVAIWFDPASRLIATADYGYIDVIPPVDVVPECSDTVHVTKTFYNVLSGRVDQTVDTEGRIDKAFFDNLGRTIKTVTNVVDGGNGTDQNVTIETTYTPDDNVKTFTAINSSTGDQVTNYVYGTDQSSLSPLIYSNNLLAAEIYPDADENSPDDRVKYCYNRLGERIRKQDQSGTVHEYEYDLRGRMIADRVTTLGTGVDGTVRCIATEYAVLGQISVITSLDENNNVVNQVHYQYNSCGQLQREYIAHHGTVDTESTPFIEYEYDITKNGDYFINDLRQISVTYPSGKIVSYQYDDYGRVAGIVDGENPIVEYSCQGFGSILKTQYVESGLTLDYTPSGSLDRFGQITDHAWQNASNQDVVRIQHGYSRNGNRLYRKDGVIPNADELYSYDGMNQIKSLDRGTLNSTCTEITNGVFDESWNFDETGNWLEYDRDGDIEIRTHNAANEILNIVTYDANGNTTVMPSPNGTGNLNYVYDAWNRMVTVTGIASYQYDGRNYRISKTVDNIETVSFFNQAWQELESQTGTQPTNYVWGLRYIDDLVLRDKGAERLYSLADPNWNVVAMCDTSGDVQERYYYDAFGKMNVLDVNFAPKVFSDFNWNRTFTGQVIDDETDLILYRNRYYNVLLGRWASRDPIEYEAGDVNVYRYVGNTSPNKIDTDGLCRTYTEQPVYKKYPFGIQIAECPEGYSKTKILHRMYDPKKKEYLKSKINPDDGVLCVKCEGKCDDECETCSFYEFIVHTGQWAVNLQRVLIMVACKCQKKK